MLLEGGTGDEGEHEEMLDELLMFEDMYEMYDNCKRVH